MSILNQIKVRCGIPEAVTVYDEPELNPLISDALEDMRTAGVPERLLEDRGTDTNPRVLTAVTLYVQGMRGSDRTDTYKYINQYRRILHKLMLEPEEEVSDVDDIDQPAGASVPAACGKLFQYPESSPQRAHCAGVHFS